MSEFVTQEQFNAAMSEMRMQLRDQQNIIGSLAENNSRLSTLVDQLIKSNNAMSNFLKNMLSDDKIILPFVARGLELMNNPTQEVTELLQNQIKKPAHVHFKVVDTHEGAIRVTYHLPDETDANKRLLHLETLNYGEDLVEPEWVEYIPEEKMLGAWIIEFISTSETLKPGVPFFLDISYSEPGQDAGVTEDQAANEELSTDEDIGDVDETIHSRGYEAEALGEERLVNVSRVGDTITLEFETDGAVDETAVEHAAEGILEEMKGTDEGMTLEDVHGAVTGIGSPTAQGFSATHDLNGADDVLGDGSGVRADELPFVRSDELAPLQPAIADEDLMAAAQAFDETQNAGEGQTFEVETAGDVRDPGVDKATQV